jgi:hypothetical protein
MQNKQAIYRFTTKQASIKPLTKPQSRDTTFSDGYCERKWNTWNRILNLLRYFLYDSFVIIFPTKQKSLPMTQYFICTSSNNYSLQRPASEPKILSASVARLAEVLVSNYRDWIICRPVTLPSARDPLSDRRSLTRYFSKGWWLLTRLIMSLP